VREPQRERAREAGPRPCFAGPPRQRIKEFYFFNYQKHKLMFLIIFDSNLMQNLLCKFLSNDIICSDNSEVIKVLLKNILRMLKLFPLRT
jgi:hypothetical protein